MPKEIPQTPSEPGDLPERFADASQIQSLTSQMLSADQQRSAWRSSVEALWSGEPVYPLDKLRKAGQGWRARTNYRGLEGAVSNENTLDYDLETQAESIVRISLDLPPGQERSDMEQKISEEFKWLLQVRWKGYNYHVNKRIHNKNLHGIGMHLWPDTTGNWIPRTPNPSEVLFPDQCPFNFDEEGDYFMLRDFVPSYVLYRKIEDEAAAKAAGWDVDVVWKALTQIDKTTGRQTPYGAWGPDQLAKQYRDGDIGYYTTRQSGVWIDYVFVREYETGKVSEYAIAEGLSLNKYLYKKRNKYDGWPLEIFPYDIGTGSIHSVKGMGARMKEFFEMMNRVQNSMVDQVMLSAYPSMKQTIQNMDPDKMKLSKMGGLNWLPFGGQPEILRFPDLSNGPLALMDSLEKGMYQNNRGSAAGAIEQQDRMTGQEYQARAQEINHLSTGSEALQRAHLDKFYERIMGMVCKPSSSSADWSKMAKDFRDRLAKRGVPLEILKQIAEVRAVVAYGKGSASARISAYERFFQSPSYINTSDDRKVLVDRGYTAALFGQVGAEEYSKSMEDNDIPDADDSFAVQENNALVNGGEALAAARQNHSEHLQIHFGKIGPIVQAYQQGQADPQQTYAAVSAFGPHIKQHLDFLAQNPLKKQEYQQYFNQWQALSRIADKLRADIESAAQAEPPEQQASDKLKIGLANAKVAEKVGMAKVQSSAAIKAQQQAAKERMEQQKMTAQQQRDNVRTASEIQRSNISTAASITQDSALTAADIHHKKQKADATK